MTSFQPRRSAAISYGWPSPDIRSPLASCPKLRLPGPWTLWWCFRDTTSSVSLTKVLARNHKLHIETNWWNLNKNLMKGGENATYRTTLFGFLVCLLMNIYLCGPPIWRNTRIWPGLCCHFCLLLWWLFTCTWKLNLNFQLIRLDIARNKKIMAKEQYILFLIFFESSKLNKKIHFAFADILVG